MVVSKLSGGIGNQLFQYAAGRNLAVLKNTEHFVDINPLLSNYNKINRPFALDKFNVNFKLFDKCSIFNKITKYNFFHKELLYKEKQFHYDEKFYDLLSYNKNIYLDGYWQSQKYFLPTISLIKYEFTFLEILSEANNKYLQEIANSNSVSIHIRRGDYLQNQQIYNIQNVEYYYKSISIIKEMTYDVHFFIFTDDIEWVQNNLSFKWEKVTYVTGNDSGPLCHNDLRLMSACKHNIIANSSFSWWAAWLNKNPEKIVIAPEKWFMSESYNTKDLIVNTWIVV